jgi:hypothetical protein
MIVDQHQPVVEKYYGSGKMTRVIARLLDDCDRVIKGLVESWEEERSMKRKVRSEKLSWLLINLKVPSSSQIFPSLHLAPRK